MSDRMTDNDEYTRIREDLSKLGVDFRDLFDAAVELGKNRAGTAKEKLQAGIIEMKRAANQAKLKGGEAVEVAQDKIKERPLTAVLVAFGAGILLGKLLDRR